MDDGGFTGHGLKLYTNAFNVEELQLLIKALDKRPSGVGLKATINKTSIKNQYTLYLSKNQLPLLRELCAAREIHMHPTMLYKLKKK